MLSFFNLTCTFNNASKPVLDNINLCINKGKCIFITGRSGEGKSTFLKIVNGVIPSIIPAKINGDIQLNNKSLLNKPLHEIGIKIGSVFQDCRSQFFMTHVIEELNFASLNYGCNYKESQKRLDMLIELFDLKPLLYRNIFKLSSGERQKIAIASVVAYNPDIILLDEPSANLDKKSLSSLSSLLKTIKNNGTTIIIADHRLHYSFDIADEFYNIKDGKLFPQEQNKFQSFTNMISSPEEICHIPNFLSYTAHYKKDTQPILKISNLSISKNKKLLNNFSIDLYRGESIAITGSNGTGKTSLLRVLSGLDSQTKGNIFIKNNRTSCTMRNNLCSFVMQDPDYQLFTASVHEELLLGTYKQEKDILSICKKFCIDTLLSQKPQFLSMGQKQRTLLAASFLSQKDIILLDEPTSGMDYQNMELLVNIIKELTTSGKLIITVTHDYDFIHKACTKILYFSNQHLQPLYTEKE